MRKFLLVSLALTLAACSSDSEVRRQEYLDADYYTRLELPPDLTAPDTSRALRVPKPGKQAMQHFKQQTAALLPAEGDEAETASNKVAVSIPGIEMHTDASGTWLEINRPADQIWPLLKAFWLNEGIPVKRSQPALGLMETDWVSKLQVSDDAGFFEKIFSNFEPDRVDRFTLQLQQSGEPVKTRVTVTHAGMEMVVQDEDSNWRSREREPALETEILRRLALFLGKQQALLGEDMFEHYRPFASRVKESDYHDNSLELLGDRKHAMTRLLAALQEMDVTIADKDEAAGVIKIEFDKLAPELRGEERDEFAEASWLMNLFRDDASAPGEGFTLQLTEHDRYTRIDIKRVSDEPDDSVLAEQLSASLKKQLR